MEAARRSNNGVADIERAVMHHFSSAFVKKPCVAKMGTSFLHVTASAETLQASGPTVHVKAGA